MATDHHSEPVGLYEDPVVYDVLHAPGTADEYAMLRVIADRFAPGDGTWLEPACGTARILRHAARQGERVAGFDLAQPMLDYADERFRANGTADRATVFNAPMQRFASHLRRSSIGFAFNTINTIRHLMTDDDLDAHLADIAAVLGRKGCYAVGLSTSAYGLEFPSEDVWVGVRGTLRVTQTVNFDPPADASRIERVYSHLTVERPNGTTHHDSAYTLRTYSLDEWLDAIERSPLKLRAIVDEAAEDIEPTELGYALYILAKR